MSLLGEVPVTISRPAQGEYVDGLWTELTSPATLILPLSIQPLKGREVDRLPEGQRTRGPMWVYCESELRPPNEDLGIKGDTFAWSGCTYEVGSVEDWTMFSPAHYKALALLVEPDEE
jgi:hypothetical protein